MIGKYLLGMLLMLGVADEAAASLWKISRACRWDWVPDPIWVLNFAPVPKGLFSYGYDVFPRTYWSLESFTTDFVPDVQFPDVRRARNWLWVTNNSWRSGYSPEFFAAYGWNPATVPSTYFVAYAQFNSGWLVKWTTSDLPLPNYIFFRARAGTGSFPSFFANMGSANGYGDSWSFRVQGKHYAYDSVASSFIDLGTTQITNNCDIGNWGFYGENSASI
jgi:hypothetical protein